MINRKMYSKSLVARTLTSEVSCERTHLFRFSVFSTKIIPIPIRILIIKSRCIMTFICQQAKKYMKKQNKIVLKVKFEFY